ncbi:hypothetical protein HK405_004282, partial [Cladochytrium tenue]
HLDVVDFFSAALTFYRRLPTYKWLTDAGIVPSNSTTYTLSDLQAALTAQHGALPYIGCSGAKYDSTDAGAGSADAGRTVVSEVWYYYHVHGRPQEGVAEPVNTTYASTCATSAGALSYYERTAASETETSVPY